jgi:hypothetical protein
VVRKGYQEGLCPLRRKAENILHMLLKLADDGSGGGGGGILSRSLFSMKKYFIRI